MDIGKTIADLRAAKNMSQQELAGLLFVSRELVSKWETGLRRPDYAMIEAVAGALDVPVGVIADRNDIVFGELAECIGDECELQDDSLAAVINSFLKGCGQAESAFFVQRYYHLKNTAEIAAMFGVKENYVRSLLSRTRKRLRRYVKGHKNEGYKGL